MIGAFLCHGFIRAMDVFLWISIPNGLILFAIFILLAPSHICLTLQSSRRVSEIIVGRIWYFEGMYSVHS